MGVTKLVLSWGFSSDGACVLSGRLGSGSRWRVSTESLRSTGVLWSDRAPAGGRET